MPPPNRPSSRSSALRTAGLAASIAASLVAALVLLRAVAGRAPEPRSESALRSAESAAEPVSTASSSEDRAAERSPSSEPAGLADSLNQLDAERAPALRVELTDEFGRRLDVPAAFAWGYDARGVAYRPREEVPSVLTWAELPPGRFWIQATAPGFQERVLVLEPERTNATLERSIALAREDGVLLTVLDPSGRKLDLDATKPHLAFYASPARPERELGEVLDLSDTHACGWVRGARLAGVDEHAYGLLTLACEPPLYVTLAHELRVVESQRLEPGVRELVFVVDPERVRASFATLRLRVVDAETRRPIAEPNLACRNGRHVLRRFANTEPVPEIVLRGMPPGRVTLELRPLEHEAWTREVELEEGGEIDLGEIALRKTGAGVLELELEWPEGLEGASVCCARAEALRVGLEDRSWETDSIVPGETLELRPGNGRWVAWAEAEEGTRSFRSTLYPFEIGGDDARATLVLAALVPLVIEPIGERRWVRVLDEHGFAVDGWEFEAGLVPARIELVPGAYRIAVRAPDGRLAEHAIEVGSDGASFRMP